MHPVENIRGIASDHLSGRRIVVGVSGSIAAVKVVELCRELIRHGATVHVVMSEAAQGIVTPAALEFGSGNPVITKLGGQVEHVQLLGDVPEKADLLLVAPATANTVSKMALGIDDGPVTTCATVAIGTKTPIVIAPAMHDAMLQHPIVAEHAQKLLDMGMTWVEPRHEEKKAKLADIDAILDACIKTLASGPHVGKRVLVVGGATAEPLDPVRVVTNRSSGKSALILTQELRRAGADVALWYGHATQGVPEALADCTTRFTSHADLLELARKASGFDQIWMPAAINDYAPEPSEHKISSEQDEVHVTMRPLAKIIEQLRSVLPEADLIAFKAESDADQLESQARDRMARYGCRYVVANTADAFGADATRVHLVGEDVEVIEGSKEHVLRAVVRRVGCP